jgi:putative ATP-binding cassette transporter
MNLLQFLYRTGRGMLVWTIGASLISGACNAGIIALVNRALQPGFNWQGIWALGFAALGLGKLASQFASQVLLARFSQSAIAGLRRELVAKIIAVPLRQVEQLGAGRLLVALTEDVLTITQALLAIPTVAVNAAILFGGAVYLAWLSWPVLAGIGALIVLGALGYRVLIRSGFGHLHLAREAEDRLFGHFRALTEGIKELKLHRERRGVFLREHLEGTTADCPRHNVAAEVRFLVAHNWSHMLFFGLVGLILFGLPRWESVSREALTGYVITTLYLMGPLAGVMGSLSVFGRAQVALEKVEALGGQMAAHTREACPITRQEGWQEFERLQLAGVTHSYHREREDTSFVMGPIDLVFERGELVFLVGGNGSGKSTLAKIITGLYAPEQGEIRVDGHRVDDAQRDDYRQLFSAVFADFYLFDSLVGLGGGELDASALEYLERLQLTHKVQVRDGVLSTTALSSGQRKRLALLTAYLEDRSFYLFDEWASDQDPQFKEVFYTQLLPELKARGKTVLVITHDDKYFSLADRIVKLDYGQIVEDTKKEPALFEMAVSV